MTCAVPQKIWSSPIVKRKCEQEIIWLLWAGQFFVTFFVTVGAVFLSEFWAQKSSHTGFARVDSVEQGEVQGGRNHSWLEECGTVYVCMEPWTDTVKGSCGVDTSPLLSRVTFELCMTLIYFVKSETLMLCHSQFLPPSNSPCCGECLWICLPNIFGAQPELCCFSTFEVWDRLMGYGFSTKNLLDIARLWGSEFSIE